jgi:hypothetical protein
VLDVAVVVDERLRARQPAAVDDRCVVELVGEDHVAGTRERGDHAGVGEVSGAEQKRGLPSLESRQPLLQPAVDGHRARDQPRGAGADPPASGRIGGGFPDARVIREPEVVVRAQQEGGLTVDDHVRALRAADAARAAIQPQCFQLAQPSVELDHGAEDNHEVGR